MGATVDTRKLDADLAQLVRGLDRAAVDLTRTQAELTASTIASQVPVRTGRLKSTVGNMPVIGGYGVTYGGQLPYRWYIEGRTHAVNSTIRTAGPLFIKAAEAAATAEANRI